MTKIALVAAVARNGVIGRAGELPWRIPADMRFFKAVTMGKPLVMGRKTFESIGRPLPGRPNIVVSRSLSDPPEGVFLARDLNRGLTLAQALAMQSGADEIAVIGGGEIYKACLPRADRIYLTEILADVEGDTMFPELDRDAWREASAETPPREAKATHDCRFVTLDRRSS